MCEYIHHYVETKELPGIALVNIMGKCIAVKLLSQKSLFVSLQFLYLEALNQDGTPSPTTARTPSFCQGAICQV